MYPVYLFLLVTSLAGSPMAIMKSEHTISMAECTEIKNAVVADVRRQVRRITQAPVVVQAECYTPEQARARERSVH